MQIVRAMAGFSFGQADLFRRAISKKKVTQLEELKSSFLEGCQKNGKDPKVAEKVYDLIYRFANYGFNKSNSGQINVNCVDGRYWRGEQKAVARILMKGLAENDIDTILLPKIRFDMGPNFKICELNEREKWIALERTCFTPFDSESLRLEWVRKRKKNIDEITENRYDTIHDLIKNKQILKLEYGPESEQTKIIEDIDR